MCTDQKLLTWQVVNSRFCRSDIIKSLSTTIADSQVPNNFAYIYITKCTHSLEFISQLMDASHVDEHTHIANHMTPGHSFLAMEPLFFLGKDGLNFAALDYLTGFVRKVCSYDLS